MAPLAPKIPAPKITGGCLCKAVRYEIAGEPVASVTCWCRDCQYIAAGSGTVNLVVKKEDLTVHGELKAYEGVADSGNATTRRFCPACGTPLFSDSSGRPHHSVVRAGTLDEPSQAKPGRAIWVASAPSWASIDPDIPHIEHSPPSR